MLPKLYLLSLELCYLELTEDQSELLNLELILFRSVNGGPVDYFHPSICHSPPLQLYLLSPAV